MPAGGGGADPGRKRKNVERLREEMAAEQAEQKRLAKKLKLKGRAAKSLGDDLDDLFGGFGEDDDGEEAESRSSSGSSGSEDGGSAESESESEDAATSASFEDGEEEEEEEEALPPPPSPPPPKKQRQRPQTGAAYVPPHLRHRQAGDEAGRLRKGVKRLLNKLTEGNLQAIVGELILLHDQSRYNKLHLVGAAGEELLDAVSGGHQASQRFAGIAAACVAGLAGQLYDPAIGAQFLRGAAERLDAARGRGDADVAQNLAMVVAYLYVAGLLTSRVVFSLLAYLTEEFAEVDVAVMYQLLRTVGMQLRAEDPAGMKRCILDATERAEAGGAGSHRKATLVQVILDIKNNRRGEWTMQASKYTMPKEVVAWAARSGVAGVALDADWGRVRSGALVRDLDAAAGAGSADESEEADGAGGEGGAGAAGADAPLRFREGGEGAGQSKRDLLKAAAAQRMNTDTRRTVFCLIMGGEDYLDAYEKLVSLGLKGSQEREIARILVDCCLQEETYNLYYLHLAKCLCKHSKQHRISLKYAVTDQFKELHAFSARRAFNLCKLAAELAALELVPLLVLRPLPWETTLPKGTALPLRVFVEVFFLKAGTDLVHGTFLGLSTHPGLAPFRNGMALFLHRAFQPYILKAKPEHQRKLLAGFKAAVTGLEALDRT